MGSSRPCFGRKIKWWCCLPICVSGTCWCPIAGQPIQHMQKAMEQMNVKLTEVVSEAIIKAILRGERDPVELATLRDPRCKGERGDDRACPLRQLAERAFVCAGAGRGSVRVLPSADHR